MKHKKFGPLLISVIILACGNSPSSTEQVKSVNSNEKSCLEEYADLPCNILSAEKVFELTGIEASKVELGEPITSKIAGRIQCAYLWNSGRTEKVKTAIGDIDAKLNDKVDIGHFRIFEENNESMTAESWFERSYPTVSAEELKVREARYKEKLAKGEKDMVEEALIRTYLSLDRKRIEGLGDRALVDIHKTLTVATVVVMDKNTSFQVSVDISEDVQENIEVAKKVARSVLAVCD